MVYEETITNSLILPPVYAKFFEYSLAPNASINAWNILYTFQEQLRSHKK